MEIKPKMGSADSYMEGAPKTEISPALSAQAETTTPGSQIAGLTEEESNDYNLIEITLKDPQVPIVVLFGPPACGKTMTLVRLAQYLHDVLNYTIEPDMKFRPDYDKNYRNTCNEFKTQIGSHKAAQSTSNMSFMLLRVIDPYGNLIAQLLEAPGELYYNPNNEDEPNVDFPHPVKVIKSSGHRKIWCYLLEPQWKHYSQAGKYVAKIRKLHSQPKPNDRNVFLYNKVDQSNYVISPGVVNKKSLKSDIEGSYPNVFVSFQSKGIFGTNDNFEIVPFQTGDYTTAANGTTVYSPGPDEYPALLWKVLYKLIKGY